MMVGVLIAFALGNGLSMSIYDVLLDLKGLPYLPALKPYHLYEFEAKDIMTQHHLFIYDTASLLDIT